MHKIEFVEDAAPRTRIKVIGVGGGGCNILDSMIDLGLVGVDFCNINTDTQALALSKCANKIQIGAEITNGMGCGADPALGEKAAQVSKDQILEILNDCEMVFIAAGLGGGTGTGASPVIAEMAKSLGLLTVAIVTKPFSFEGPQRQKRADRGLAKLSEFVDSKIVIMNDKLVEIVGAKTPLMEAFAHVNHVLSQGVRAISDLISVPGLINVDFMDIRTIMGETGGAVMGVGIGKGENRAAEAVKKACQSPLQEKIVIEGARGVLISITASPEVAIQEINTATSMVYESADSEANIIFGVVIDPQLKDEMRVTIIATGFPDEKKLFAGNHSREEHLSSPKTDLDLEAKIRSMMPSGENKERESGSGAAAGAAQQPKASAQQMAFDLPPAPSQSREPAGGRAQPAPKTQLRWDEPEAEPAAVSARAKSVAEGEAGETGKAKDYEIPALLRRRKSLFE